MPARPGKSEPAPREKLRPIRAKNARGYRAFSRAIDLRICYHPRSLMYRPCPPKALRDAEYPGRNAARVRRRVAPSDAPGGRGRFVRSEPLEGLGRRGRVDTTSGSRPDAEATRHERHLSVSL